MIRFETTHNTFYMADGAGAAPTPAPAPPTAKRKEPGAFDRKVAAELQEAEEVASAASLPAFAPMLNDDYEITPQSVNDLGAMIVQARQKFGIAASGASAGEADTGVKDRTEIQLIAALRRIQTGARLSHPDSASEQARYFIGTNLENAEDQLVQIATTVLENLKTDTLRGVKAAQKQAVQDALTAWQNALATQGATKGGSRQDRLDGESLLNQIGPRVREIKVAIDGEFPYTDPTNRPTRKQFHMAETRPFTYIPRGA